VHDYPKEVDSLSFEVFSDCFTSGFPVQAFFMDEGNSEYFIMTDGKAEYPSPVDSGLLSIDNVYPIELEEEFENRDEDFDPWAAATAELIEWFSKCWLTAGGADFKLDAHIAHHDSTHQFNLITSEWHDL